MKKEKLTAKNSVQNLIVELDKMFLTNGSAQAYKLMKLMWPSDMRI